jgi:hypothetical protein
MPVLDKYVKRCPFAGLRMPDASVFPRIPAAKAKTKHFGYFVII